MFFVHTKDALIFLMATVNCTEPFISHFTFAGVHKI